LKYFMADEISPADIERIDEFLEQNAINSDMEHIYWVEIPGDLLNGDQARYPEYHPYLFSIELSRDSVRAELFLRTLIDFQGKYQGYATDKQRTFISNFMENMLTNLGIQT